MKTTIYFYLLIVSIGSLPLTPLLAEESAAESTAAPESLEAEARPSDASTLSETEMGAGDEVPEGEQASSVQTVRSMDDSKAPGAAPADDVVVLEEPGDSRVNAIRGIVADALEEPGGESQQENAAAAPSSPTPAVQSRWDELRSAVGSANQATDGSGDLYISTLRQEGNRTRVIDEETSRRPAVAQQAPEKAPEPIQTVELAEETPDEGRNYRVQPGDSFWKIAERVYGDGYKFLELYEANKDRITDENLLVVGQVIRIPALD